jgi:glutaredoxin
MKTRHLVAACCALAAGAALAQTQVYRWVDKDGKVHFSDSLPPADAQGATQKTVGGGPAGPDYPYSVQQAMKKNPVVLYTAPSCGEPCDHGRQMLSSRGIPFGERDVQTNTAAQEALKKLIGGLEVPTLTVGSSTLKGYEPDGWASALTGAGYPATRMPGQAPTRATPEAPTPTKAADPSNPQ